LLAFALFATACGSKNKSSPTMVTGAVDAAADAPMLPTMTTPMVPMLDCSAESPDWPMFGQNVCNTSSQLNAGGISVDNVKNLKVKWSYNAAGEVSATPAVVGKAVYIADWGGMVSRIDADTGTAVWSKSVKDLVASPYQLVSRTTPVVTPDAVVFGTQTVAYLFAVDPDTGSLKWKTQMDTHPAALITSSPVLDGNRLYVGVGSLQEGGTNFTFRGSAAAVDVATGNILWQSYTITDAVYYGNAGGSVSDGGMGDGGASTAGYAGAAIWSSSPAVDRKRKQLYVTTGNNYAMPDGGVTGNGNWVDSVLALDLDTGAIKWGRSEPAGGKPGATDVFTLSHRSGPDSDFGCGANLFPATINGHVKDLVGAGQKSGDYWAFDADTGETVWTTHVGPGGPLGGLHWGTSTDGVRVYVENNNTFGNSYMIQGNGPQAGNMSTSGAWAALDVATGQVIWQIEDPALDKPMGGATVDGPTVVVNGVMFGGSMDAMGTMYALNAATGDVLWSFQSGGTVYGGPAVANGVVYWGCGYKTALGFGTTCQTLYAFDLGN
jgi:polyvinyl alcohol dehydrogenase (cytochrome)